MENYKNLGKYIPSFNYYKNLNSKFDQKFLFITNNISENINMLLNSNFKTNYPSFEDWRKSIFKIINNFGNNKCEITRCNTTSKILIYYIKNLNINNKNIKLLSENDIKNLKLLMNNNNNYNDVSIKPISNILGIEDDTCTDKANNDDDESIEDINNDIISLNNSFGN